MKKLKSVLMKKLLDRHYDIDETIFAMYNYGLKVSFFDIFKRWLRG